MEDVTLLETKCKALGLQLNRTKCEVISHVSGLATEHPIVGGFVRVSPGKASLLGAPLSNLEALEDALRTCTAELGNAFQKMQDIARHDALTILRYSLGATKLLHTLRCCPCSGHPGLARYDTVLRLGLSRILNLPLTEEAWLQATLPIKVGGLGIRSVSQLALPAFLASAAGTDRLQSTMLSNMASPDPQWEMALARWQEIGSSQRPETGLAHRQSAWDRPLLDRIISDLRSRLPDPGHRARLGATMAPHAGDWLLALPVANCGLKLDDEAIRVAVGLRLGTPLCEPHRCPCGALVASDGLHGLSCTLGPGRLPRHASLNDLVYRALVRAGFPSTKEPSGLTRTDGRRPDGLTLVPWRVGRCLVWDATVTDTLAASYLPDTSQTVGAAAERAASRKHEKYLPLSSTHVFIPLAFETMGPINDEGRDFLSELGRKTSMITGDPRETSFLFQRISLTIQRFNSIAFRGTFASQDNDE